MSMHNTPIESTKVSFRPRVKLVPGDLSEDALQSVASARQALLTEERSLTSSELRALVELGVEATSVLTELAHDVRLRYAGATVEIEGIVSAKTGGCPEDCHFCSQSSQFPTDVKATPFLDYETLLRAAEETKATGASEFCIVLAVRGPDQRTMDRLTDLVPKLAAATGLQIAVSAGILTPEQAAALAAVGVHRYNHNLETARSYFPSVVTTHTYDERLATCRLVQENNMELCCGVLLGMGESDEQRFELLETLRELQPSEVPMNFLNPRPGTPFADLPFVEPLEALRWIALFRIGLPSVILRYAGGREVTLRDLQDIGMTAGINALIVGNYLTTLGRTPDEDLAMLESLEMPIGSLSSVL